MHYKLMFPKQYLAAHELQGKDVTLTICDLGTESMKSDKGEEEKWCLYFKEMEERNRRDKKKINKRLVLNVTNANVIAGLYGNETKEWVGKRITLYATQCQAFGKTADCIRIRDRKPKADAKSNEDVIPKDEDDYQDPGPPEGEGFPQENEP